MGQAVKILNNGKYFIKEAIDIFRLNLLSNIFSLLSTSLIFFVLALVISGWSFSSQLVDALQDEAQIGIYGDTGATGSATGSDLLALEEKVAEIDGVRSVTVVTKEAAYERMEEILGTDAKVLSYFVDNPFEAFMEAELDLTKLEAILGSLEGIDGIGYIRDNRDVLEKLDQLAKGLRIISYVVLSAVGIATLVILSHAIRQSIYHYRKQIVTLELLGAPTTFIAIPFFLEGLIMTLLGGAIAIGLSSWVIGQIYMRAGGPLPFVPLPALENVIGLAAFWIMTAAVVLGLGGSAFGFGSSRKQ